MEVRECQVAEYHDRLCVGHTSAFPAVSHKLLVNRTSWPAAFDKGDLLYLRDEEEKRRFLEKDQRESERSQFLAMRARENAERDASLSDAPRPKDRAPVRYVAVPTRQRH